MQVLAVSRARLEPLALFTLHKSVGVSLGGVLFYTRSAVLPQYSFRSGQDFPFRNHHNKSP